MGIIIIEAAVIVAAVVFGVIASRSSARSTARGIVRATRHTRPTAPARSYWGSWLFRVISVNAGGVLCMIYLFEGPDPWIVLHWQWAWAISLVVLVVLVCLLSWTAPGRLRSPAGLVFVFLSVASWLCWAALHQYAVWDLAVRAGITQTQW